MSDFWQRANRELSDEVLAALDLLKSRGFAACVFTVTELRGADPRHVEESMIQRGWDAIDTLATETHPEDLDYDKGDPNE